MAEPIPQETLHLKRAEARRASVEGFRRSIRITPWIIVGSALFIAAVADILSIFQVGWVIAWLIPVFTWFMQRRISGIRETANTIAGATRDAERKVILLRQRLASALTATGNTTLLRQRIGGQSTTALGSYLISYVCTTIVAQIFEALVPLLNWLPLYLGQIAKMMFDQSKARQAALALMPAYEEALTLIDALERFEVEYTVGAYLMSQESARTRQAEARRVISLETRPASEPIPLRDITVPA